MPQRFQFDTRVVAANANSQDVVSVIHRDGIDIVVLADGAGNSRMAGAAAQAVIGAVESISCGAWTAVDESELLRLVADIDSKLAKQASGESTGVICVLRGDEIIGASVGDSGAWVITDTDCHDLTAHQRRKPLLGSGEAMPVPFRFSWTDGLLLVASGGLLKYTQPQAICKTVRGDSIETICDRLLGLVRLKSGGYQDDVAFAVARHISSTV